MNAVDSNLQSPGVNWLPQRYRSRTILQQDDREHQAIIGVDRITNQAVYVESLPASQFDADDIFRLEQFFNATSEIKSVHYVSPIDWGRTECGESELLYWVRPHVDGKNFESAAFANTNDPDQSGLLQSPAAIRSWLRKFLSGLESLHAANLTQQDFRLTSILTDGETPRLLSPGLRLFSKPKHRSNSWSISFGQTASPELLGLIEHDVNHQSDIYSVGVILYCLVNGQLPFKGNTLGEVLSQHLTQEVVTRCDCVSTSNLMRIAGRMLEKNPVDRYRSVASILNDLDWLDQHEATNKSDSDAKLFVAGHAERRDTLVAATFAGRQPKIGAIRSYLDDIKSGKNRTLLVTGDSGNGKTRLIQEALRDTHNLGVEVYRTDATENGGNQSNAPLTRLINGLKDRSEIGSGFVDQLIDEKDEICNFFPEFARSVGLLSEFEIASLTERDDRKEDEFAEDFSSIDSFEFNRLCRATCSVLSKLSGPHRPAVIWIDDCQWLDANTIEALNELSRWKPQSLLLILSSRTSSEAPSANHLSLAFDARIHAGPLPDAAVRKILNSMAYGLPKEAVDIIVGLASGSPFMAEALLRGMVESKALYFKDSGWHVNSDQLVELQASSDASEALLMRLEQFPPQVLELLSVAAVIGKSFALGTVCALTGTSVDDCRTHMDWARKQRIVWTRPDGLYSFLHDRIRNAMITRLPSQKQQSLHIKLAEHIESEGGSSSDVAVHFDLGGEPQRAVSIAIDSARQALKSSTLSTALKMLQIAWRGLRDDDSEQQSHIAENIGHVLMLSGQYEDGDLWFDRAAKHAQTKLDRARIQMRHSELAFKKGAKSDASELLEDAMESLDIGVPRNWISLHTKLLAQGLIQILHSIFPRLLLHRNKVAGTAQDQLAWQMYSRLAHCYWYTRSKSATLWAHLAGMNAAESYMPTRQLGQAWSEHAPVMGLIPWYSRGAQYIHKSLKVRKQLKDFWGEGQSRNYFSLLLYATSRYQRCIKEAKQSEEILLKTGDYWELNITRYQHAASLYRLGRLDESIELCKKTYDDAFKVGDYQSTGNIMDVLSRASLGNIPFQDIEDEKKRCLDDAQLQTQLLRAEGVYHLENGDPSSAVDCFEQAISIAKKAGVCNCYTAGNGAWLATSIRLKCELEESKGVDSRRTRKQQLKAAKKSLWLAYRFRNDLPHALRELGYAWMRKGNQRRARKYFSKSLKVAHRQNARYEAALTQKAFESLDLEDGFRSGKERRESGDYVVREIESKIRKSSTKRETISIADRFDVLLDAGRKISSALSKKDILEETISAAKHLLRGQETLVLLPDSISETPTWNAWNSEKSFDPAIVSEAHKSRKTVLRDSETIDGETGGRLEDASVICCPIIVGEQVSACIYIANRLVKAIYGREESRIVDFIANAAGSSLEKEASFRELDELNAHLEEKVWERTRSLRSRTNELEKTAQELRATQHSLQQAVTAAESANQIKSDFLAKMSHEIRTPITAVLGFTQLILRGVISDPEEKRKKIRSIESSGKHLLNLVNDLLDISKIEANKIETEKIDCRPLHLLSEVVESLRSKAIENENELKLNLVSPMPATIQSDPKRLRQVVTNILGNAIKFTSGGDVTLNVTLADSSIEGRAYLRIDVTDSGIGMSEEQVQNVFDPFVQADSSITRRFGGTGLGLSISRKLAHAMGGEIEVTSEEGVGSTFSITIDAGERSSLELLNEDQLDSFMERRVSSDAITADLTDVHILLADDAETNRDLISLVLSDCGAKVTLAHNGQEAVDLATADQTIEIILMDMQMPVLDGYSATAKLRELGCELPVFALTANSMKGDREKCIDAGCSDYLTKPININTLVKTIARTAGRNVTAVEDALQAPDNHQKQATDIVSEEANGIQFEESDLPPTDPLRKFSIKFLGTLNERWGEFEAGVSNEDAKEIASLAHWLKGTSGTVALLKLSEAAKAMETSVRESDWADVAKLKDQMRQYLDVAIETSLATAAV